MSPLSVPTWIAVLGMESEEVEGLFRDLLRRMPLTASELARRMGVAQSTVSRWATGATRPSLDDMSRAIEIVRSETAAVASLVDHAAEIVSRVGGLVALVGDLDASLADRQKASQAVRDYLAEIRED